MTFQELCEKYATTYDNGSMIIYLDDERSKSLYCGADGDVRLSVFGNGMHLSIGVAEGRTVEQMEMIIKGIINE